jgi:NtrC-family two-component system response regulator AlgB
MSHVVPPEPMRVLVIDDEKNIRTTIQVCLEDMGCRVTSASTRSIALAALHDGMFDLAFLDLRLGTESGMDLLPALLAERPGLEVIVITAYATFDTAVEAIRRGARDYVPKPFSPAQIRGVVERVQQRQHELMQLRDLQSRLEEAAPDVVVDTASPRMQSVLGVLDKASAFDAPVLLLGENGTGKGVLARRLHAASRRREHPFVAVNCPTLSDELLASELFGHARGAFTGAVRDQPGRVEAAEGGTLFLDEVGELPLPLQSKLLRFLQEKQFERIGESRTRKADVRVVAATNRNLADAVRSGTFREDLLYRLNTIEIVVPPLRDRKEDIAPLARSFLAFFSRNVGRPPPQLTPGAEEYLKGSLWPGNVRELRNAMERALILAGGQVITPEALGAHGPTSAPGPLLGGNFTVDEIEREHILRVIARTPTLDEAARVLGLDASTLWRKRKKYET